MKNEKISLVFFGSGPVAATSLEQLAQIFDIEFVVTKTTTKQAMEASAPGVMVHTADDKKELDVLMSTLERQSQLGILIDFGIIVSKEVIDSFPQGIINSHFSRLPELRGADPISFAILNGQTKTGVSLMLLNENMDEGPILAAEQLEIGKNETTGQLTDRLVGLSVDLLKANLLNYVSGKLKPLSQEEMAQKFGVDISYTRKLKKTDGQLDWLKEATALEREIRAFQPWPKSRADLGGGIEVIITEAVVAQKDKAGKPGELLIEPGRLFVGTGKDWLEIKRLKPAGKSEMTAQSFLAGYGKRLET